MTINCRGALLDLSVRPLVMGIINVTPDSFYDGNKYYGDVDMLCRRIDEVVEQGADIIDVGACSSRPGASFISEEEEWSRLELALYLIGKRYPKAIVSVDTYRASIARMSVENGASIINDISAGSFDREMVRTLGDLNVPYILTHIQGEPGNMQVSPAYSEKGVVHDVRLFLSQKIFELRKYGVKDILIDPGFGFGKRLNDNYSLVNGLQQLRILGLPILVGVSRKSMIYNYLNLTPQESLNGTTILNTISLLSGANILRVHDVKEAREAVQIVMKIKEVGNV